MALSGKVDTNIEVKAPADKLYEMLFQKPSTPNDPSSPLQVQSCDLVEGDWGKEGSIICWNYTYGGEPKFMKEKIEAIDVANKSMTLKVIDGDLMKEYKSLLLCIQVTPKPDGSVVNWAVEYDKSEAGVVPPEAFLEFGVQLCKGADAYFA